MKASSIEVSYLDKLGSDLTIVNAARVSFGKQKQKMDDNDVKLISYLAKNNHWSPFAHVQVQFRLKAPIFVARQLVKHQVGLVWNEVSRRYVDSEPEFYFPTSWRARAENVKQGSGSDIIPSVGAVLDTILKHNAALAFDDYRELLSRGVAPEQARMVLPLNTMTEWVWTGSLMAWARVCNLRLDPHAQLETQIVAKHINNHMKELFPVSWKALVNDTLSVVAETSV